MAKLVAHGAELHRFFSMPRRALLSVHADGVTLGRTPFSGWKVVSRKKPDVPLADWRASVEERYAKVPEWMKKVTSLPSLEKLTKWESEGICKTPTGHTVEPDGYGPDGVPSWLLIFGMI